MRNQLESIRPIIKDLVIENKTGTIEVFQNKTLRPILKFQNNLILSIFKNHLKKHKISLDSLADDKKDAYIEKIIKKDRKIYQLFIGIIIGHFTDNEYQEYFIYDKEFNRRIINILIQRLQNQL